MRKKLDNPPIDKVIVAIQLNDFIVNEDEIEELSKCSYFKKSYQKINKINAVSFVLGESNKITNNIEAVHVFSNTDETVELQISNGKILFLDGNKYTTYENFINKFYKAFDEIKKFKKKDFEITKIGLRYINIFSFSYEDYNRYFKIKPQITVVNEEKKDYALIKNYMSVFNIEAPDNDKLLANVKAMFKISSNKNVNIVFDIDTTLEDKINSEKNLQEKLIKLKDFKNDIFYSHFNDIYNIKEFKDGTCV